MIPALISEETLPYLILYGPLAILFLIALVFFIVIVIKVKKDKKKRLRDEEAFHQKQNKNN